MTVDADLKFAIVPEWVLFHPDLSAYAVRLYGVLDRHANKNNRHCHPSRKTLAKESRTALSTMGAALRQLQEAGAVTVTARRDAGGGPTSNDYLVHRIPPGVSDSRQSGVVMFPGRPLSGNDPQTRVDQDLDQDQDQTLCDPLTRVTRTEPDNLDNPTSDPAPDNGFGAFWDTWPQRNGKKLAKDKAYRAWLRLTVPQRQAAMIGARHYAAASYAGMAGAKDAFRWLRDREWPDWQTPATPDGEGLVMPDGQTLAW